MDKNLHFKNNIKADFVVKNAKVICPLSDTEKDLDVLVKNTEISAIDKPGSFDSSSAVDFIDAKGMFLVPGLIDIHTHLREPGQEWKETILSGTQSAVSGGFTDVCCMPNTKPANDNASVTEFILEKAKIANLARVHPIGAISKGRKGEELSPMLELHEAGCVAFSDDGDPVSDSALMRRALEYTLIFGGILTVHEEDKRLSDSFSMNESELSVEMGLKGFPGAAEDIMIARDIELSRLTGGRVHFCHVSTARAVTLIRRAKEDGINVTAETAPHYLTLTEESVRDYNTLAKVSMPLRKEEDRRALLQALEDGVIDCIASDHAPHEYDSKNCEFDKASFGFIGFETNLPLIMQCVRNGELSLKRAISAFSSSPRKCFNLEQIKITKGSKATFTLIDPNLELEINSETIFSKSRNTPFLEKKLKGFCVRTFIDGRSVFNRKINEK